METYPLERHLRGLTITSPQFGPDGESLYFRCDLSGDHEIWELSAPLRWPRQRTFTGRNVRFGAWSPTGEELAFGVAGGADERVQLHVLDDETQQVTRLTDEPSVVHRWGGWNRDGSRFAYAANRRRTGVFDVYTQGRRESHDEARLVYEQDRPSSVRPVGWGPENDRLVVLEMHSNYDADLHLVDLDSATATLLTSGPGSEVRYRSVRWGPDGDSLYLITDRDYDWRYLARLDLATGDLEPVVRTDANVKSLVLHADRERLAYKIDRNGYSEVVAARLTGPTSVEPFPSPDFPRGFAKSLTMSGDGERLATVHCTPDTKPDLFSVAVETGETTRWTDASEPVPNDNYVAPEPLTYESFDGLDVPSLYAEPATAGDDPLPALISLHGGPRKQNAPTFDPLRQHTLERGFVRFEPNFRGSSGYGKEYMALDDGEKRFDAIRDVKAAADWLAERDRVDGDRIVLQGQSYGGFLVLAAMTRWPDRFAAGTAIAPIANFETYLENTSPWRRENREAEYGSLDGDRDLLRELSPIHDIDRLGSPLLVVHGEDDSLVPITEAEQVVDEARSHGVPVETLFVEDAGHSFRSREQRIRIFERAVEFFDSHVGSCSEQ